MKIQDYTDADWADSVYDRRSTTSYCIFVGSNLISWKSKKQKVVARSSVESEYRTMTKTTYELVWIKYMLEKLKFSPIGPMELFCDNQAAMHIAYNPVFNERTKHIEIDCHFIGEKLEQKIITTSYVKSEDQLADLLTKVLPGPRVHFMCSKFGAYDVYAPV